MFGVQALYHQHATSEYDPGWQSDTFCTFISSWYYGDEAVEDDSRNPTFDSVDLV